MGSVSIDSTSSLELDLSLLNIWRCWYKFRQGKKATKELEYFQYFLERNLHQLYLDLNNRGYKHRGYSKFIVIDNKRREISAASIRDRIIHRLLYEYLINIYDRTFIFDVWSCRKNKGLFGAIERTQKLLGKYSRGFVWRADIKKFFDSVDQTILTELLSLRTDIKAMGLLREVIKSYFVPEMIAHSDVEIEEAGCPQNPKGIPIGNLTSQIFANIYLNELDRFVKHIIKPQAYLRYGDDFIIISENLRQLKQIRTEIIKFLGEKLRLRINIKNDIILKIRRGLKFLGVWIYPRGRKLTRRNWHRAKAKINHKNIASYSGLIKQHSNKKRIKEFNWLILEKYYGE